MENLQDAVANAMGMSSTEQAENTPETQASTEEQNGTTSTEQNQQSVTTETQTNESSQTTQTGSNQTNSGESSTIKNMREQLATQKAEYKKLEETLKKITDSLGKSADELVQEAQQKADTAKANSLGVSPEVARTMREQEQRIKDLEEERIRDDFNYRANNFRREFNLNDKQMTDFFNDAIAKGFDLMRKGTDLGVIYRAINFDRLSAAKEAEIRQQILNEMQQQRETANGITNVNIQPNQNGSTESPNADKDFVEAIRNNFK